MKVLGLARRHWRRLLLALAVLYVSSPWIQLDAGIAAAGLRLPHVQLVGWYRDFGLEGFRLCDPRPDCEAGIWASPLDRGPVRAPPAYPGGRYVPPERR